VATEGFRWLKPADLPELTYTLPPEDKTIVNVGSVGQPRDGNPASCYVLYDDDRRTITFRRVSYDLQAARARFLRVPQLTDRLSMRLLTGT